MPLYTRSMTRKGCTSNSPLFQKEVTRLKAEKKAKAKKIIVTNAIVPSPSPASVSAASSAPYKTSNTYSLRKRKPTEVPEEAGTPIRSAAKKLKVSHQNIEKRKRVVVEEEDEEVDAKKPKVSHQKTEKRRRVVQHEDEALDNEEPVRVVKRMRQAARSKAAKEKEVQEEPEVVSLLFSGVFLDHHFRH